MADFISRFIQPKSYNGDDHRVEFIFNVLVVSILLLLVCAMCLSFGVHIVAEHGTVSKTNAVSLIVPIVEFTVFFGLYILSRKGKFKLASYVFLVILFLLGVWMAVRWGVDLQYFILLDALLVVMSGILIGSRFAFYMTALAGIAMIFVEQLQNSNRLTVDSGWRFQHWGQGDVVSIVIILLVIAVVSWLSNREIERSLNRARASEKALMHERDLLEVKVEERTHELKRMQMEKISNLYRFAEFGRLSSGVFHDLMNLLTPVSLNMEKLKEENGAAVKSTDVISKTGTSIDRAIYATRKMEKLVSAVRSQLGRRECRTNFSACEEVRQIVDILAYKAGKLGVEISLVDCPDYNIFGDPIRFNQVILNLLTNAIEAYEHSPQEDKKVTITMQKVGDILEILISDTGSGIQSELLEKIFQPFFTTKSDGIGVGLSMTKHIMEKDFGGKISVESSTGTDHGSRFTLFFGKNDGEEYNAEHREGNTISRE